MVDKRKRNGRQISFTIPENDHTTLDLKEYVHKYGDFTHSRIYYLGLLEAKKQIKGISKFDFKIAEQEQKIQRLKKKIEEENVILAQYKNERDEYDKDKYITKESNFVNNYKKSIQKILNENPEKLKSVLLREYITENYEKINNKYENQTIYKNETLEAYESHEKNERIKEYVQIFIPHF